MLSDARVGHLFHLNQVFKIQLCARRQGHYFDAKDIRWDGCASPARFNGGNQTRLEQKAAQLNSCNCAGLFSVFLARSAVVLIISAEETES